MNDNDVEIWKNIKNYEGIYQVSSFGNIKRIIPGGGNNAAGPLKQQKSVRKANTYLFVRLCHEGKPSMHLVHRLVAETFIDKPSYCPLCKVKFEVNHKDGNGMNNHIDNLEFCTRQEKMETV